MKKFHEAFLYPLVNFILYSSLLIGLGALCLVFHTELWMDYDPTLNVYSSFVFSATVLLYGTHRLVGISKSKKFANQGRFLVINTFKNHIIVYTFISFIACCWLFFQLNFKIQLILMAPIIIAAAYSLPIFPGKRRLRDLHYIKIFLIALVWAHITVVVPVYFHGDQLSLKSSLLAAEQVFYFMAITLPFDIRDLDVDRENQVKTIPATFGLEASKRLSQAFALGSAVMIIMSYLFELQSLTSCISMTLFYTLIMILLRMKYKDFHDYFFSGMLDGTMILKLAFLITAINYLL